MSASLCVPPEEMTPEMQLAFQGAQVLSNSEVFLVLENMRLKRAQAEGLATIALPPLVEKTVQYCEKFNCGKNVEAVKEIRTVLESHGLHQFEIGTIANLLPESADEAMSLLPTLGYEGAGEERVPRLAPEEVQTMLDEVMMHRM